jgi:YHS domain-containing protein
MTRVILVALLILLIARAFWRVMDGVIEAAGGTKRTRRGHPQSPTRAVKLQRDPVCGTFVAPASSLSLTSGASTVYFCSERCREEYRSRAHA